MAKVVVHHGDSRAVLKTLADDSVDSCPCDPPYALASIVKRFGKAGSAPAKVGKTGAYARASAGFMGKKWDTGAAAFDPAFWAEVLRVLKPGAHVAAFGGTRTYHRLACAIEDAGFEIRDQLAWTYGSGFPKSHNQTGEFEGCGSALKPAWEPICLARKPMIGTIAANLKRYGTGALWIDGCRIETAEAWPTDGAAAGGSRITVLGDGLNNAGRSGSHARGRWPANLIHDGSAEVLAAFPYTESGVGPAAGTPRTKVNTYGDPSVSLTEPKGANQGSATRFFYTAKADAEDRLGSKHPTVKPVDLMCWLSRLITPPGGTILDPFAGTGTTGLAAMREGFDCILIEREAEYVADIERRLAWARGEGRLTAQETSRSASKTVAGLPLFGDAA